jgi:hypothetical protein
MCEYARQLVLRSRLREPRLSGLPNTSDEPSWAQDWAALRVPWACPAWLLHGMRHGESEEVE